MSLTLECLFRGEVGRNLHLEGRPGAVPGGRRLTSLQWHQATSIEARFEAIKTKPSPRSVELGPTVVVTNISFAPFFRVAGRPRTNVLNLSRK